MIDYWNWGGFKVRNNGWDCIKISGWMLWEIVILKIRDLMWYN